MMRMRDGSWMGCLMSAALLLGSARAEAEYGMTVSFPGYSNRTEVLSNFPVLVVLSNNVGGSGFSYSNFLSSSGYDLRFQDADGSSLNYEIESWNAPIAAPTNIPGCRLWLDGSDVDGDSVVEGTNESYIVGGTATWKDKSGAGNDFTNNAASWPTQSVNFVNGHDVLSFNGSSTYLTKAGGVLPAGDKGYEIVAVWYPKVTAGLQRVYEQYASSGNNSNSALLASAGKYGFNGEGNDKFDLVSFSANQWILTDLKVDNSLANNIDINHNGANYVGKTTTPGTLYVGAAGCDIGRKYNAAEYLNGYLAEMIVYTNTLTVDQRSQIGYYLQSKYGIAAGYNPVSYVWVQVPAVTNTGTGSILTRWGADNTQLPCTTNGMTWDSNFKGVWHLGTVKDSTSNRLDLTAGNSPVNKACNLGTGYQFDNSSVAQYLMTTNIPVSSYPVTIEGWFKTAVTDEHSVCALSTSPAAGTTDAMELDLYGQRVSAIRYRATGSLLDRCTNSANYTASAWQQGFAIFKSATERYSYLNGANQTTGSTTSISFPTLDHLVIGGVWYNNQVDRPLALTGSVDEVRISNVVRSSNWVWACYLNQASNQLFSSYGTAQPYLPGLPQIGNTNPTNITTGSAFMNGTLTANGLSQPRVYLFWGPRDGITNMASWANTNYFGTNTQTCPVSYSTNITSLSPNTLYYYRYYATNDTADTWAPSSKMFINGGVGLQKTADAFETGLSSGTFTVYRAATATNVALTINYTQTGTAVSGTDFQALPGFVTIPAGATTAPIVVTPLATPANANDVTLGLTLTDGNPLCLFDTSTNATLSIASALASGVSTCYVDVKWTGAEVGTPTHPFRILSNAVATANAAGTGSHTIYVACGTNADVANGGLEDFSAAGGSGGGILVTNKINFYGGYAGYDGVSAFDWTAGTRVPRNSIIDLQGASSCAFYVNCSGTVQSPLFDGLTFRNANAPGSGGAIYCYHGGYAWAACDVNNCLFTNNVAAGTGGALYSEPDYTKDSYILNSDFINNRANIAGAVDWNPSVSAGYKAITNCTFIGNVATNTSTDGGGAILLNGGGGLILGCTFSNNAAGRNGGAVLPRDGNTTFQQCRFYNNTAPNGAAIGGNQYWLGGASIENCLFYGHTNGYCVYFNGSRAGGYSVDMNYSTVANNPSGGVYAYGGGSYTLRIRNSIIVSNGGTGILRAYATDPYVFANNDVFGHTTSNYYACAPDAGSLSTNPVFMNSATDFRLAAASPCIDAGTNTGVTLDLAGIQRPTRNGYDLGCYEERNAIRIVNLSPAVSSTNATLRGQIVYDGNTNAVVTIYWGPTDGGTTNSNWAHTNMIGGVSAPNTFQTNITAVVPGNTYWFRCFATNWYGAVWADSSMSFDIPDSGMTKLWTGAGTNALASNPSNWFDNVTPTEADTIKFDNVSSNATWDAAAPHSVASWVQTLNYTGTVTIGSGWSNGFDGLTISNSMTISGGRLTHLANPANGTAVYRLKLKVLRNFTLAGTGINVDGLGYVARKGPGAGTLSGRAGSYGGEGYSYTDPVTLYGSLTQPEDLGSGGYDYSGGGAVYLDVAGTATVSAAISANNSANSWAACGSGGSIFLRAGTLVGNATLSADGYQTGGVASYGGGGGRIAVVLTNSTSFDALTMHAYGGPGEGNAKVGAAGTVYKETTAHLPGHGILVINNNNQTVRWARTVIPTNDLANVTQIVITNRGVLGFAPGTTFDFGNMSKISGAGAGAAFVTVRNLNGITFPAPFTIAGYTLCLDTNLTATADWTIATNGGLSHSFNEDTSDFSLNLNLTGNLIVNGVIDVRGGGYVVGSHSSVGPGFTVSCGGSYGGLGNGALSNKTYGSILHPQHLGSGADSPGSGSTSTGGGKANVFVSGNTAVNGSILVGALDGNVICGSGGSLYLQTGTFSGTGLVSAAGGCTANPAFSEIGGGGGRIAVKLNTGTDFGSVRFTAQGGLAGGGNSRGTGSAGTLYLETSTDGAGAGQVILDNGTVGAATNGNQWTELPGGMPGYPFTDDLKLTRFVVTNLTMVRLSTNVVLGSLTLNPNSYLELAGYTGTVGFLTITNRSYRDGTYAASDLGGLVSDRSGGSGRVIVNSPRKGSVFKFR